MKTTLLLLLLLLAGSVLATNEIPVALLNPTNPVTASGFETFEAKILKAYLVNDGNAVFRAYVVLWKGQEVVANDLLAESNFREGDSVKVMVMRIPSRNKGGDHESLNFHVMPNRSSKRAVWQKSAGDAGRVTFAKAKEPFYIDCQSNSVTLYPGSTTVTSEALLRPDNAVDQLLDQIQTNQQTQSIIVLVRPDSVKVFRSVRRLIGQRPIDASYDVVDAGFEVKWGDEAGQKTGVHSPRASSGSGKQPMFFECRNNQVFYVDKVGLDEKVAQVLAKLPPGTKSGDPNGFVKAISGNEITNEYYKVSPSYLLAMIMALESKPGVRGDGPDAVADANSNFQRWLQKLNADNQYLVFLVRDNSFPIYRKAREIAEKIGFDVGWELLDREEPIKFGTGGQVVPVP